MPSPTLPDLITNAQTTEESFLRQWFGETFSTTINVTVPGTVLASDWWGDWDGNPGQNGWATATDCGTYWYIYSHFSNCAARGYNMTFNPGFLWNGRGFIHCDWVNCGAQAATILTMRWRKQDGSLSGVTTSWNDCAHTFSWQSVLDQETGNCFSAEIPWFPGPRQPGQWSAPARPVSANNKPVIKNRLMP